jgi:lysine 6-dehydrogenase
VTAKGMKGNKKKQLTYTIIDFHDEKNNVTAMMRMTAYPASIIAQMLAAGAISQKGVVAQECCVEPDRFLEELRKRNIEINIE